MSETVKPYRLNWLKGLYEIGPFGIGFFDGPVLLVLWRRVVRWEWRPTLPFR